MNNLYKYSNISSQRNSNFLKATSKKLLAYNRYSIERFKR